MDSVTLCEFFDIFRAIGLKYCQIVTIEPIYLAIKLSVFPTYARYSTGIYCGSLSPLANILYIAELIEAVAIGKTDSFSKQP